MDHWRVTMQQVDGKYLNVDLEKEECGANGLEGRIFTVADYVIFGILFLATIMIGLFYGCYKDRKSTASDYFVGNRQMHFVPVAMSLVSELLSAISVLGNPAEMYNYGSQLYMFSLAFMISTPLAVAIYIPIYEKLKITSVYEYINLRFHSSIRSMFSIVFLVQGLVSSAMYIYAPALALAQVTNLKVYVVVLILFSVCVFFGSIGGVKAIIWSDTLHLGILVITLTILLIKGSIDAGGVDVVWNENYNTDRIELFNFNPDPTVRHTFWTVFVGGTIYWTAICAVNQTAIQRFLALPNMREVYKTVWLACAGKVVIYTILFYVGMLIYNAYKTCDPLAAKMVQSTDQLLPLYVMDVTESWPGFPGIVVASIFSSSIGDVATMLNGMTAVTVEDVVIGYFGKKLTPIQAGTLSKFICLAYGLVSLGLVFVVSQFGALLESSYSWTGLVAGVGLGVYTLGVFFPWANSKGAIGGIICSFAFMIWVVWGSTMAEKDGYQFAVQKTISVENCLCNATLEVKEEPTEYILPIYKVSYLWYTAMGMTLSIITGIIISGLTTFQDPREMDQALLSPLAKWFFNKLPLTVRTALKLPIYDSGVMETEDTLDSVSLENNIGKFDAELEGRTYM